MIYKVFEDERELIQITTTPTGDSSKDRIINALASVRVRDFAEIYSKRYEKPVRVETPRSVFVVYNNKSDLLSDKPSS